MAHLVARAFAAWVEERSSPAGRPAGEAAIGRDNRPSSPELAEGLAAGLAEAGWSPADLGVVPTPVFYFALQHYGLAAGIMVTGSHNEAGFNGFKLAFGHGTLHGEEIRDIQRRVLALAGDPSPASPAPAGVPVGAAATRALPRAVRRLDPIPAYLADVSERVKLPDRPRGRPPLRVAVDCGSGTACLVALELLRRLGCEVFPIYAELDGTFPGHWPDPSKPENLGDLKRLVLEAQADLGLAFDGDADRLGVVDDTGEIIPGDLLMILFWRELLPRHPGAKALVEVKCSQALVDEIQRLGGEPLFCRTGHSLIKAKMRETGALFAGEMSGHMFFADEYYGFDDAVYASARLLRLLARAGRPLSALLADRPRYFATPELRLECPDGVKFAVVEAVKRRFVEAGREVIDVDGARVVFPDGWLLVRASNTQPAVVLRCEGKTPEALEELKSLTAATLAGLGEKWPAPPPAW